MLAPTQSRPPVIEVCCSVFSRSMHTRRILTTTYYWTCSSVAAVCTITLHCTVHNHFFLTVDRSLPRLLVPWATHSLSQQHWHLGSSNNTDRSVLCSHAIPVSSISLFTISRSDIGEPPVLGHWTPLLLRKRFSRVQPLARTCICTCVKPLVRQRHHKGHFCDTPDSGSSSLPCLPLGYHHVSQSVLEFSLESTVAGENGTTFVDL